MIQSSSALTLLTARFHILRNRLLNLRRDSLAKGAFVLTGLLLVIGVGYVVALHSFEFIEGFLAIGPQLNSRLLGLLFMVLFTMVTISSAIVAYTSLFLAKETGFFFEHPVSPGLVFFFKLSESIAFSGWATLVLGLPVLVAFGVVRDVPLTFYPEVALTLFLFIFFCGTVGALLTVFLLFIVRRWTLQKLLVVSAVLVGFVAWGFLRSFDIVSLNGEDNLRALNRFALELSAFQSAYLPSRWATDAILAASVGHHSEVFFQMGLLLANSLIAVPLLQWYASRFYGKRWTATIEPAPFWRKRTAKANSRTGGHRRKHFSMAENPMDALTQKDLVTFFRSPAQVSQFVLFLVLTAVYVLSLTQIPSQLFSRGWRLILYFSNVAAICLIMSSFTARFLFPLVSLEGKAFWIVGLAPIRRSFLIRQKVWFGRYLILTLGICAAVCSTVTLRFDLDFLLSSLYLTVLSGWVLTALAVGFGAAYPNLTEDNPARIAVGFGGTLNFFASVLVVVGLILIEAVPYLIPPHSPPSWLLWSSHLAALLFSVIVARGVMRVGERALQRMDF